MKLGNEDEKFSFTEDQKLSPNTGANEKTLGNEEEKLPDFPSVNKKIRQKNQEWEISINPINLHAYTKKFGEINKCQLMDTLLPGRVHLTMQLIDLINDMVHRKYENQYPIWVEEILDVTTQLLKIDPRWELKTVLLICGHIILRNHDCNCDPPFFPLRTKKQGKIRAKIVTINDLMRKEIRLQEN